MLEKIIQLAVEQGNTISVVVILVIVVIFLHQELKITRKAMSDINNVLLGIIQDNTKAMVKLQQLIKCLIDKVN